MYRIAADGDDELALIRRLQTGDVEALAGLYYRYEGRISRFLSRLGLAEQERAVVVNETMFTVWKSATRFDPTRSRLSTWIFGIARNKCRKAFEASRRHQHEDVEALENVAEWHDDIASLETREWLAAGLASLPAEQRMVLELTFLEGLSYAEIAEILDCPVNTVKTRVFHARRKLRAMLPEERARTGFNEELLNERL